MSEPQTNFIMPQPDAPWWRQQARVLRRGLLRRRMLHAPAAQKKTWNAALNWREFWHGRTRLESFPRVVQVGTNWTCNLRCAFCRLSMPWTREEFHKKQPAELQLGPRVLETVKALLPYTEMMTLTPLGEPLLWGGLRELLEVHAALGSRNLALTSNGMLLDDAMAERLVRGQLNALFLSIDSNDPEVYASMRVGADLRQVEEGIRRVTAWKERLHAPDPRLTINATFLARNLGQLPSMVDWAHGLGASALSVQLMEIENPELEGEFLGHHTAAASQALEAALRRGREIGFTVLPHPALTSLLAAAREGHKVGEHHYTASSPMIPEALKHTAEEAGDSDGHEANGKNHKRPPLVQRCAYPWYNLLIDTDGEARPCCWADVSWGNLNRLTLEEIWNGPRAMGMRQAFLKNIIPRSCQHRHCRVDL